MLKCITVSVLFVQNEVLSSSTSVNDEERSNLSNTASKPYGATNVQDLTQTLEETLPYKGEQNEGYNSIMDL